MPAIKVELPSLHMAGSDADYNAHVNMSHTIYEDPVTRKFAIIRLPIPFDEGDKLPIPPTARWFATREEAIAALPDLFNEDE